MSYGMEDTERRGSMTFPNEGNRAVDVPLDTIQVRVGDGIVTAEDPDIDYTYDLGDGDGLSDSFEKVRSMVLIHDVDIEVTGLFDEPQTYQAGITCLQNLPETEQFKIDYGADQDNLVPAEAQTRIMVFNSPTLPLIPNEKAVRGTKDNSVDAETGKWKPVMLQPGFPYSQESIVLENKGSDPVNVRFSVINAGKKRTVDEFLASNNEALKPSDTPLFLDNSRPAATVVAEVKAESGTPTVEAEYTGEAH